jgi:hypothetical protein
MFQVPTYGGYFIFGSCCHVVQHPDQIARQEDAFFAVPGVLSLVGGTRGRSWTVEGVLVSDSIPDLTAQFIPMTPNVSGSFVNGTAQTFVDSWGNSWPNVLLTGDFTTDPEGPHPVAGGGWAVGFRVSLRGLS